MSQTRQVDAPRSRGTGRAAHAPRVALALAGGGPLGAIYEIGALCALDDCLQGLDFNACDHYVGVSAGGFIAAGLANGMTPRQICDAFIADGEDGGERFDPACLMTPAYGELGHRLAALPGLLGAALWELGVERKPLSSALERLGPALPTGLFSNEDIHRQLERLLSQPGRSNDFRQLRARLTLVATHLDSGEAAPFGRPGWDHVPISRAVQASAALPGLYPPVCIRGHHFVDGALRRTMHASVALDKGIDLLLGVNPFVPFNASRGGKRPAGLDRLEQGGLPVVLSQTFRTLLQSRVQVGLEKYARQYPHTDQLVMEPDEDDGEMFFTSVFSYDHRLRVCEYAFRATLKDLRERREALAPLFARHGLRLRDEVLDAPGLSILDGVGPHRHRTETTARLARSLDELEARLREESRPRGGRRPRPRKAARALDG